MTLRKRVRQLEEALETPAQRNPLLEEALKLDPGDIEERHLAALAEAEAVYDGPSMEELRALSPRELLQRVNAELR